MLSEAFQSARNIGIFTHVNPDGDALGSSLGLYGFLDSLGKECRIFVPSAPPESLEFMIPECLKDKITVWNGTNAAAMAALVNGCDLLVGLDFNTMDRIREWGNPFKESAAYKILVDHHVGPERAFFDEVYSETEISSTCELLYSLLMQTPQISSDASKMTVLTRMSLMTGLTTDTNNFANSVFPGTLTMASQLLAAGTDRDYIIQKLFFSHPRRRLDAQGYILSRKMKVTPEGAAYIIMEKGVQNRFQLQEGDTEGFVNIPLSLEGVRMSILVKEERGTNTARVSVRSKKGCSAREFCVRFYHGGGHEQASGGKILIGKGLDIENMGEAEQHLRKSIREFFNGQQG